MSRVASAKEHARPGWSPGREKQLFTRVERKLRQRRIMARSGYALAGVALALVVVLLVPPVRSKLVAWSQPERARPALAARVAPLLELSDGSAALAASNDARVEPVEITPNAVLVRLTGGAARFRVTPRSDREFRVVAGGVTVTVLGTVFVVELRNDGVEVRVERGRVRAETGTTIRTIAAGQKFTFDTRMVSEPRNPPVSNRIEAPAPAIDAGRREAVPQRTAEPSWRLLAQDGEYERAYRVLTLQRASVREEPGDLMLAADVARLSGHGNEATKYLRRVLDRFGSDSRAPLAAFTLGRVLLDQLGRPHEAAEAFTLARKSAPGGALAQDALAREVESWARAGDPVRARARAEEYLKLFPNGRRRTAVRRYAGL
jgi:transmembrane sensor